MATDHEGRKKFLTGARPLKARRDVFSKNSWKVPSGVEIKEVLELIDLTEVAIAEQLRIKTRTIRKWKSGDSHISFANWFCLCWLAGLGPILTEQPKGLP
ncbi:korC [Rahnella sp. BCC 1045]|uniref:korC n=1 Tax=Rahnella sp. BCC 1045 TaxID=2816251 RepID=UPI001C2716FE|nr:korC [Rahnella sp. BCC 1045]MBU9818617.1 korC [Rahnella sp. BCC 1045]